MSRDPWRVQIWGVRGSAPRPAAECLGFGGNTVCTSLRHPGGLVILDAGSGLVNLGAALEAGVARLDILLGHLHLDHVQGLFPFAPLYDPAMEVHLYGPAGFRRALETLLGPPYWPLGLAARPARLRYHEVAPGDTLALPGLRAAALAGRHPGGSLLYRLDGGGHSLVYALDCEPDPPTAAALTDFARDCDLLIWDAAFAPGDLRPGWGHSTWEQGAALGRAAGARTVLMTHYDTYSDTFLQRQEDLARRADPACRFAREGMVIVL